MTDENHSTNVNTNCLQCVIIYMTVFLCIDILLLSIYITDREHFEQECQQIKESSILLIGC